jgi:superfamily II DNA or RNA helicase
MTKREQVQKEASDAIIASKFRSIVEVSPRVGKTKLTIDALNTVEKTIQVLVIAPRKEIFDSWKVEIDKWNLRDNIKVTYLWSNSLKKNTKAYDLIIADEVHAYNLKVLSLLQKEQRKGTRILALTGTLDGDTQYLLESTLGLQVVYTYSVKEAIEDGIIADYEIICVGVDLDNTDKYVVAGSKEKPFLQTEYEAYTYYHTQYEAAKARQKWGSLQFLMSRRVDVIYNSRSKIKATQEIVDSQERCIIFTGRQEVADKVGEESFHSKSSKDTIDKFKNGSINKLAAVGKLSMGVTFANLKVAIFNQMKSGENDAIQKIMRAMNREGTKKATIYIVYLKNTQDYIWLQSALKGLDSAKIKWL